MVSRRRFLSLAGTAGVALALPNLLHGWAEVPHRRRTLRLGYLAPPRPDPTQLAAACGAVLGIEESRRAAQLLGRQVRLFTGAANEGDLTASVSELTDQGVIAVVGCGGVEWSEAARQEVESRRLLFINIGCSDDRLRSDCHPLTFHVQASTAMYLDAVAECLVGDGARRWLVVADESASDRVRRAVGNRGGTVVGSVNRETATRQSVLSAVEKDGADVVCLLCPDAGARLLADWPIERAKLKIVCIPTGDSRGSISGVTTHRVPTIRPVLWHSELARFGAEQLNQRFERHFQQPLSSAAWAGWLAMKILWESSLKADAISAVAVGQWLADDHSRFDGHKGASLTFRSWDHQLRQPLYVVRFEGGKVTPLSEVPRIATDLTSKESLDRLGDLAPGGSCDLAYR